MFLVCGEALWDLFAVEGDGALRFDARIGGSPFNVAVGLARLEVPSALLTGISTDRLGQRLTAALEREGVSTRFLQRSGRPTTLSLVDVGADGSPAYAFYGEGAADRALDPDAIPPLPDDCWGLHLGSYSLVVEPVGGALLALAEREARRRLVTLDPNARLTVAPDAALWRERIERLTRSADLVKVSDEDIGLLYPGESPEQVADRWRAAGAAAVIVTRGAQGAEAFSAAGRVHVAGRKVSVADTVGAGDSFMAATIAGLDARGARSRADVAALGRDDWAGLLGEAARAAAIVCSRVGADLPRKAEMA